MTTHREAASDADSCSAIAALRTTHRARQLRAVLFAFALFGSLLPFSFGFGPAGVEFLFADGPAAAASVAGSAALFWLGWLWLTLKLRNRGQVKR